MLMDGSDRPGGTHPGAARNPCMRSATRATLAARLIFLPISCTLAGTFGGTAMNRLLFGLCAGAAGCILVLQFPSAAIAKGQEAVLYRFGGRPDGKAPSSLIDMGGTLNGTTSSGGTATSCSSNGC